MVTGIEKASGLQITQTRDNLSRLTEIKDGAGHNATFGYDNANNLSSVTSDYTGLGDGWVPIGDCGGDNCSGGDNPDHPFSGNFNGNSNVISNLVVPGASANGIGLFGYSTGNISDIE